MPQEKEFCCKGCVREIKFTGDMLPQTFTMEFYNCSKGEAKTRTFPFYILAGPRNQAHKERYDLARRCKDNCWWLEICWKEKDGLVTEYTKFVEGTYDERCCPEKK